MPELDLELTAVEKTVSVSVVLDTDTDILPIDELPVAALMPVDVFCTEKALNAPAEHLALRPQTKLALLSQGIA
jgi:hypothetical protein